jgi:hypothetical protein
VRRSSATGGATGLSRVGGVRVIIFHILTSDVSPGSAGMTSIKPVDRFFICRTEPSPSFISVAPVLTLASSVRDADSVNNVCNPLPI